jgi:parallel beta-helix repeat protein
MTQMKSRLKTLAVLAALLLASVAQAEENKTVFSSDTVITADLEIPPGSTCIIKPGVRVLLEGYRTIAVRGILIAEGSVAKPIVFKAVDRPSGSRERPSWKGIEIIGRDAGGQFKHCRFEGAYRILAWESNPSFDSCTFAGNHYGLYCAKKAGPHVNRCRFLRNSYGIAVDYSYPLLLDNIISENVLGLYLQLCSEAVAGRNIIEGNETDIRVENAFGENPGTMSLQKIWNLMQQIY